MEVDAIVTGCMGLNLSLKEIYERYGTPEDLNRLKRWRQEQDKRRGKTKGESQSVLPKSTSSTPTS